MTVQVDFWQLVLLLVAFLGACAATFRYVMGLLQKHLDTTLSTIGQRLHAIETANKEEMAQWQRVERELLDLKSELPLNYVRREDHVRGQSVVEAKLDGLALKIENLQLRSLAQK
jgi:flagellar motility protein MotE (MotC chaperone)